MHGLVFPAVVIAIVSAHWQILGEHTVKGLKAACASLPTPQEDQESLSGARVLERLVKIRISNYKTMSLFGLHMMLLLGLDFTSRFLRQPRVASALPILPLLLAYLFDANVASGKVQLTSSRMTTLSFLGCGFSFVHSLASFTSYTSATDHLTAISVSAVGHMLTGLVFLNARLWVPSTIMLSVIQLAFFAYNFGHEEISPILLLNHFAQSLICCSVPVGVEIGIRAHLRSQVDARSHEFRSLKFGV